MKISNFKIHIILRDTIGSILLFGVETCTMTKSLSASLDGYYSRLPRYALIISWTDHVTYIKRFFVSQIAFKFVDLILLDSAFDPLNQQPVSELFHWISCTIYKIWMKFIQLTSVEFRT